jgi:hypothetical protein
MKTTLIAVLIILVKSSLSAGTMKEPSCFTPDSVGTMGPYKVIITREYKTSWERSLILKAENILPNVDSLEQLSKEGQKIALYKKMIIEKAQGKEVNDDTIKLLERQVDLINKLRALEEARDELEADEKPKINVDYEDAKIWRHSNHGRESRVPYSVTSCAIHYYFRQIGLYKTGIFPYVKIQSANFKYSAKINYHKKYQADFQNVYVVVLYMEYDQVGGSSYKFGFKQGNEILFDSKGKILRIKETISDSWLIFM